MKNLRKFPECGSCFTDNTDKSLYFGVFFRLPLFSAFGSANREHFVHDQESFCHNYIKHLLGNSAANFSVND